VVADTDSQIWGCFLAEGVDKVPFADATGPVIT